MVFHIITLFPEAFSSYLNESILKRAIEDKKIKVKFYNPRDFADNKLKHIDKPPYGGGPGMVIQALPVIKAVQKAVSSCSLIRTNRRTTGTVKIVWLSPNGEQFETKTAKKFSKFKHLIIICGRYEGIDARVKKAINSTPCREPLRMEHTNKQGRMTRIKIEEISIGPYVLTGGELPAMTIIDSVSRQVEGVLGNFDSREEERVASSDVYTRPEVLEYKGKKYRVPKILLSGHRAKIEEWKQSKKTAK